ncbi:protein of unknown function [Burkholderia multivorans]
MTATMSRSLERRITLLSTDTQKGAFRHGPNARSVPPLGVWTGALPLHYALMPERCDKARWLHPRGETERTAREGQLGAPAKRCAL